MKWLIYKHTLNVECEHFGWSYIGQTCQSTNRRWRTDGTGYICYTKAGELTVFAKAILKYGWENFTHEVIEDNINTIEEANARERYWVSFYHTYVNDPDCAGYNMTIGGGGSYGYKHSENTKKYIKQKVTAAFPEGRAGEKHSMYGKRLSEETKQKISKTVSENPVKYWLDKHRSEETKEKLRKARTGKRLTDEQKLAYANKKKETKIRNGTDKLSWVSVQQYSLDGDLIKTWQKLTDASNALKLPPGNITKVCQGIRKSAGGFRWQYTDTKHFNNNGGMILD